MQKMNKEIANFEVRPGVVLSGKETEVRICPRGRHAWFGDWSKTMPGKEHLQEKRAYADVYVIEICPMEEAYAPRNHYERDRITAVPEKDGSLVFSYTFHGEQEYRLIITKEGDTEDDEIRLALYSLFPDLYGRRVYRGDLHVHSFLSDAKEEPAVVAANYRKYGYDFMALTDHQRMYPSRVLLESYKDVPVELAMFTGEEVHVPDESNIHAINFGGQRSVNEYYANHTEEAEAEVAKILERLDVSEEAVEFDAVQVAQRLWVAEKIREFGGFSVIAHPNWVYHNAYHMPQVVLDYLFKHQSYDAFELIGGLGVHENNLQTAYYEEERTKGYHIPVVGSTDSHGTEPPNCFDEFSTLVFAENVSFESLTDAVRSGCSVAVEECFGEGKYRLYGKFRCVKFGRYLMRTFFPRHDEMCWEQGRLMKAYILEEKNSEELLRLTYGRVEEYAKEFFGY